MEFDCQRDDAKFLTRLNPNLTRNYPQLTPAGPAATSRDFFIFTEGPSAWSNVFLTVLTQQRRTVIRSMYEIRHIFTGIFCPQTEE